MARSFVVFGTALALILSMPIVISRMMARARGKRQRGSYGLGFDSAFDVLDPAKARARETIQIKHEIGESDESEAGELSRKKLIVSKAVRTPRDQ